MRKTGGFRGLMETLFGLGGAVNPFDDFGHFVRAVIPPNVCFDYTSREQSGCESRFNVGATTAAARALALALREPVDTGRDRRARPNGSAAAADPGSGSAPDGAGAKPDDQAFEQIEPPTSGVVPPDAEAEPGTPPTGAETQTRSMRLLLDFLLAPEGGRR